MPEAARCGTARRLAAGLLLAAAAALSAAACAGPERSEPPVDEATYVEVMGRLAAIRAASDPGRRADPLSGTRADSLRRAVLAEHGVSRPELEAFARAVGDEPARMEGLWKRIGARADSLTEAGWPVDTAAAGTDTVAGADTAAAPPDTLGSGADSTGARGDPR